MLFACGIYSITASLPDDELQSVRTVSLPPAGSLSAPWASCSQAVWRECFCARCLWTRNCGEAGEERRAWDPSSAPFSNEGPSCCNTFRAGDWDSTRICERSLEQNAGNFRSKASATGLQRDADMHGPGNQIVLHESWPLLKPSVSCQNFSASRQGQEAESPTTQ